MKSTISLTLANRCRHHFPFLYTCLVVSLSDLTFHSAPKQPIRKLPPSIEIPDDATVEDAKIIVARQAGIGDYNRIGLFDSTTKKILKNRRALVRDHETVLSSGQLLVKDLGSCLLPAASNTI